MLRIDDADELPARLTPRGVECFEISARRKPALVPAGEVTFAVETTSSVRVRDGQGLDVRLKITGTADFFDATVDVAVLFDFVEELEVPNEVQQAFLTGRGVEIAYPYAKEAFEQAIARIGFPALLPLVPPLSEQPEQA